MKSKAIRFDLLFERRETEAIIPRQDSLPHSRKNGMRREPRQISTFHQGVARFCRDTSEPTSQKLPYYSTNLVKYFPRAEDAACGAMLAVSTYAGERSGSTDWRVKAGR